ncbi:uncharacterized protein E0L32_002761 [Thyridium curvatum]|uniref:Uncharacterized protein n=1 Tax=Thyridium curvatum TaxID=1093900 RepID=A0A507B7F4_9PEZI|nr:uncharacterized protein E0L32_002761 [Thyridium curvatum]TPX18252.1 hypothetical protein E0L32_002761 [Thyridium curvatum]
MDSTPPLQPSETVAQSPAASRSFSVRSFIRRDTAESENDQPKGPLGLTTLHNPGSSSVSDIVFVHGLNGGSQSTWCRGRDDALFWPKKWLPKDESFRDARIHTFGYASGLGRESILNVNDFATSLLSAIQDAPSIPSGAKTPIVLVGHSMGGLVIKKAYSLGRQTPPFESVASRICALFFLATPHQGADLANSLDRILALIPGSRPFVKDIMPHSPVLQAINEEFPRYCGNLQLFSFFETKPMLYGIGNGLIVEKHCAVMNLPNERRNYLNANHRNVARFTSPEDPCYLTVRNTIATLIGSLRRKGTKASQEIGQDRIIALRKLLRVVENPEDDIHMLDTRRLQGAGDWLLQKQPFVEWRDAYSSELLWLRGRPGAGKSFLAGNVVNHLRGLGHDVSWFFFSSSNETKSNPSAFLRSMAYQMAVIHPEVLATITGTFDREDSAIDQIDHHAIWRQIFLSGVLKTKLDRPQHWVIDAMDECKASSDLVNFLTKAQEFWPLCIFVTSRYPFEPPINKAIADSKVVSLSISDEDSNKDIDLFLNTNMDLLPAATLEARQKMADRILENSSGCFLWANLMLAELRQVQTASEIQTVFASNPHDMDHLYLKILENMSRAKYGKDPAKAILAWATCSFRPLTTDELHAAVQMDVNDTISDIEKSITASCGNLVYVDRRQRLQLVHLTAKEFLTRKNLKSEFAIDRRYSHTRLAIVCLNALTKDQPKGRAKIRRSFLGKDSKSTRTPFSAYASDFVFQHLFQAKSSNDEILELVARFFGSTSILDWIEYIATRSELHKVYHAGRSLLKFLGRRAQHIAPLSHDREIQMLERWGNDLVHLVPKFSRRMIVSPASIHHLIPPFCPHSSIIYQQFHTPSRGLNVQGLAATGWDDCLSTMHYPKGASPFSAAAGLGFFAIGFAKGRIMLYDDTIFQEVLVLEQKGPVWCLRFGDSKRLLASAGPKIVSIWDLDTGTEVNRIEVGSLVMSMAFTSSDGLLVIATKSNQLMYYNLEEDCLQDEPTDWTREFVEEGLELHARQPIMAVMRPEQKLLAIVYRGEDLILWDIEEDMLHDVYEKETGSRENGPSKIADGSTSVGAIAFSKAADTSWVAVTYIDGDLVVYETFSGTVVEISRAQNAMTLCSSPDGRTLAGGDTMGFITLYDFETLRALYRISFQSSFIRAKILSFTQDGQRLIDVRAPQCRVWQPTVLLRQDGMDEDISDTVSYSSGIQEVDYCPLDAIGISSILCVKPRGASGSFVLCGKEDGSVHVYNISAAPQSQQLFTQVPNCAIADIHFDDETGTLTCGDLVGRATSRRITRHFRSQWEIAEPDIDVKLASTIVQVLGSGKHSRLLISTENQDAIWGRGVDGLLASLAGGRKRHWVAHGANNDCLIRWTDSGVELRDWSLLSLLGTVDLPGITNSPWPLFEEVISLNDSRYFATQTRAQATDNKATTFRSSNIHVWDHKDFSPSGPTTASPVCSLKSLTLSMEVIVGVYGDRLVYLDASFWICSMDITDPSEPPVRHFFVPNDWLSLVNCFVLDIGKAGEIMYVKQSELAVIKRGLEVTESGTSFNPRSKSCGLSPAPGHSLPTRTTPSALRCKSVRTVT